MKFSPVIILLVLFLSACAKLKNAEEKVICEFPPLVDLKEKTERSSPKAIDSLADFQNQKVELKPISQAEMEALVPQGFAIVQYNNGADLTIADFNQDGIEDIALIVEYKGDPSYEQSEEVMLIIAHRLKTGVLEKVAVSGNLGGESINYTDHEHVQFIKGTLRFFYQSMRHHLELFYQFDRVHDNYLLIKKNFHSYGSVSDGPYRVDINYLTGKKITRAKLWDDMAEETVDLPEKIESFESVLLPLSMMDWDNLYAGL